MKLMLLLLTCGLCFDAVSDPLPVITMHYYDRPPFHYKSTDGEISGLIASSTSAIFKRARFDFHWQLTPANRILAILKSNSGLDCTPGWYKTSERETYAQFSLPIYHDLPLQGLSRADFQAPEGITAKELFQRRDLRLLLKQNFSQGAYMDALITAMPDEQVQRVTVEVPVMVKMIQANRADLIITTQEETDYFISQSGYKLQDFRILKFVDVPAVEKRYILCSKKVPPEVMNKLNEAITYSDRQDRK